VVCVAAEYQPCAAVYVGPSARGVMCISPLSIRHTAAQTFFSDTVHRNVTKKEYYNNRSSSQTQPRCTSVQGLAAQVLPCA
jgi:hypothetical protein